MPSLFTFAPDEQPKMSGAPATLFRFGPALPVWEFKFPDVESLTAFYEAKNHLSPDGARVIDVDEDIKGQAEDRIVIRFAGHDVLTYITDKDVQRFFANPNDPLVQQMAPQWGGGSGTDDPNSMCLRYHRGEFDKMAYARMNMGMGYSVCGFCDLSNFQDVQLENPLWRYTQPDDVFIQAKVMGNTMSRDAAVEIMMLRDGKTRKETTEAIGRLVGM